jgi:hypothetical protein
MKLDKKTIISFVLLILIASLYRAFPGRPWGFAPQIAMAIFGGSVISDRKLSFALPILSMFISDILYHVLYLNGIGIIPGFYEGQLTNYLLFAGLTVIGFFVRENRVSEILAGSLAGAVLYFLVSNFLVWMGGGGLVRPRTWEGLLLCYQDALPFFRNSVMATLFFSALLFGGAFLFKKTATRQVA